MDNNQGNIKSKKLIKLRFLGVAIMSFIIIIVAYSNHFNNSFHLDDSRTIETNSAIQKIDIVHFFTNAVSFSSLAANQTYRPITTLENAID